MVRIMRSKARIGIAIPSLFMHKDEGQSVRDDLIYNKNRTLFTKKKFGNTCEQFVFFMNTLFMMQTNVILKLLLTCEHKIYPSP